MTTIDRTRFFSGVQQLAVADRVPAPGLRRRRMPIFRVASAAARL